MRVRIARYFQSPVLGLALAMAPACLPAADCYQTDTSCNSIAPGGQTGTSDLILTSTDGVTWVDRTQALPNKFQAMTHTGTQFVAVGRGGVTADSNDGITWTVSTIAGVDLRGAVFALVPGG